MTLVDILEIKEFITNMRKLSESIWSDIQDRSSGEIERKEDDINLFTQDTLFEYIKNRYVSLIDEYPFENWHKPRYEDDRILVPFASSDTNSYVDNLVLSFKENEEIITFNKDLKMECPDIYKLINDNYKLSKYSKYLLSISPLDGSDVTNKFYIDLIDFLIDNIPDNEIIKRK